MWGQGQGLVHIFVKGSIVLVFYACIDGLIKEIGLRGENLGGFFQSRQLSAKITIELVGVCGNLVGK